VFATGMVRYRRAVHTNFLADPTSRVLAKHGAGGLISNVIARALSRLKIVRGALQRLV